MTVTVKRKLFFLNFKLPNHQGGICHRRKPNANKAQEKEMKMCHENQNCWQTFQVMITDFNAISLGIVRMFTRQDKLLTETQKKLLSYGNLLVPQAHDAAKSTPVTVN